MPGDSNGVQGSRDGGLTPRRAPTGFRPAIVGVIAVIFLLSLVGLSAPEDGGPSPVGPEPPSDSDLSGGKVRIVLEAGELSIAEDGEGFDVVAMEGFASTTSPGDPLLVHRVYNVLVPPEAVGSELSMEVVSQEVQVLEGTYEIGPVGPLAPAPADDEFGGVAWAECWGLGKTIVDGRNLAVYERDENYPEPFAVLLPYSEMRKWKFARVDFFPLQYNPVSKRLTLVKSCVVEISYRSSPEPLDNTLAADAVMDEVAPTLFDNYEDGRPWYLEAEGDRLEARAGAAYDYVIITTSAIVAGSGKLDDFIAHKERLGYSVLVVTESDFLPLTGQAPNNRAEKIRQWLKENYASLGIKYVLLVGDPRPFESGEGDIPMKMCWPRRTATTYRDAPTDYFYADLTGNWDKNGDQIYGQWGSGKDYPVAGGVDFTPEVYVGRIPVYDADYQTLDGILQKIILYELSSSTDWRKSALLPMAFSDSSTDGARLSEQMRDDYLNPGGYFSWRMYQQGTVGSCADSKYDSEEELHGGTAVRDRWAAGDYGIVCWWGHGSPTAASIGYSGCNGGLLFESSQSASLDDAHPSFTYQCSCLNAEPETTNNLAYSILKNGGIGTVSATRVSWYYVNQAYGTFDGSPSNSGLGYEYVNRQVQELAAGDALYQAKGTVYPGTSSETTMNWYVMNLYGDPSVSLKNPPVPPEPKVTPVQKRMGIWQRPR
ncbi:MAG TPA: C25 family cysteine peptidase [Methanothrix sp.]|jgi:hypothetical protein|nr:hypothetical protein [Methanothrix sp.]HPY72807.1 C25 family cysteine peptidase [Methanothrix sp.]